MSKNTLDLVFHALSDSTRRAMLESLCRGEQRITELAAPHDISLNAASKHIKILERAKLVKRKIVGRDHYMRINSPPFQIAQQWIARQQAFWTVAMNSIDKQLSNEDNKLE